mmetsp:Transcript_46813/g.105909  ORF Transcript_46813/g.105909 Transcript_46813/m.105909 type:complete len:299 (-) Transcript_46813:888-1784(-)
MTSGPSNSTSSICKAKHSKKPAGAPKGRRERRRRRRRRKRRWRRRHTARSAKPRSTSASCACGPSGSPRYAGPSRARPKTVPTGLATMTFSARAPAFRGGARSSASRWQGGGATSGAPGPPLGSSSKRGTSAGRTWRPRRPRRRPLSTPRLDFCPPCWAAIRASRLKGRTAPCSICWSPTPRTSRSSKSKPHRRGGQLGRRGGSRRQRAGSPLTCRGSASGLKGGTTPGYRQDRQSAGPGPSSPRRRPRWIKSKPGCAPPPPPPLLWTRKRRGRPGRAGLQSSCPSERATSGYREAGG